MIWDGDIHPLRFLRLNSWASRAVRQASKSCVDGLLDLPATERLGKTAIERWNNTPHIHLLEYPNAVEVVNNCLSGMATLAMFKASGHHVVVAEGFPQGRNDLLQRDVRLPCPCLFIAAPSWLDLSLPLPGPKNRVDGVYVYGRAPSRAWPGEIALYFTARVTEEDWPEGRLPVVSEPHLFAPLRIRNDGGGTLKDAIVSSIAIGSIMPSPERSQGSCMEQEEAQLALYLAADFVGDVLTFLNDWEPLSPGPRGRRHKRGLTIHPLSFAN